MTVEKQALVEGEPGRGRGLGGGGSSSVLA